MVEFYKTSVRPFLRQKLEQVKKGILPERTDNRNFFYLCRIHFLRTHPTATEIDVATPMESFYQMTWQRWLATWFMQHCAEFDIPEDQWWLLREKMNFHAEGRAVFYPHPDEPFLIEEHTRKRIGQEASFILLCEKATIRHQLWKELTAKGYRFNMVSTGGKTPAAVKKALYEIFTELPEEENFYFMNLHDYDLHGLIIFFDLKRRFPNMIDIGINSPFLAFLKDQVGEVDMRLIEEVNIHKGFQQKLYDTITDKSQTYEYTEPDFHWLQGTEIFQQIVVNKRKGQRTKRWRGHRIELDSVVNVYGIDVLVNYIVKQIEENCEYWDLSKLGLEPFSLIEPINYFRYAINQFLTNVNAAFGRKELELDLSKERIKQLINRTLLKPDEYYALENGFFSNKKKDWNTQFEWNGKQWTRATFEIDNNEWKQLQKAFTKDFDKEWTPDYDDDLVEINDQITRYEGDVTKGIDDLTQQAEDLQEELNDAKKDDVRLEEFQEKVDEIDWGELALEEIEAKPYVEELEIVIQALQDELTRVQEEESS